MAVKVNSEIPGIKMDDLKLKGFKVHELPASINLTVSHRRRDFYKLGLVSGALKVNYGDKEIETNGTVLFFVNPNVPHTVLQRSERTNGIACLFTETFLTSLGRADALKESPLFQINDSPIIPLNSEQAWFMADIFKKMLAVHNGDYPYKSEFIRSCIELIIHEALRIQPSQNTPQFKNASTRIAHMFKDLLERQFPIERINEPLRLRTVQD